MTSPAGADRARIVTVFRSRLRPESVGDYHDTAQRILELARTMPGFVDFKSFEAEDGERVSIVTFAIERDPPGVARPSRTPRRAADGPRPFLCLL